MSVPSKLPRKPHAERPRSDEKVIRSGGADLQNGWLARHGTLTLTETRLVFVPTPLDWLLRAKRREILFSEMAEVEREPRDPTGGNRAGRRARMIVRDHECAYEFMVGDLDSWIDTIQLVVDRNRPGSPLTIVRDNYVNPLQGYAGQ